MIKIVTDSTAYLSEETVRQHDIRVVPLYVNFGNTGFKEGVELSNEEFYTRLKSAPELPTTSQPTPAEFKEVFKELATDGHEIITLTISGKLSGTWNSAMAAAKEMPEVGISVIDTLSTAAGLELMVMAALEAAAAGASRQEIADQITGISKKMHLFFVVDTLEYLAKGGRIGNASAFLGTVLKVKPILFLQDGGIEPCEKVRSKRKAVARMIDLVEGELGDDASQAKAIVINALVPQEAQALARELQARLGCAELEVSDIGPVIGTHIGPGALGVAAYA